MRACAAAAVLNARCPLLHPEVLFFSFFHGSRRDSRDMRMGASTKPLSKKICQVLHVSFMSGGGGSEGRRGRGEVGEAGFWKGWVKGGQTTRQAGSFSGNVKRCIKMVSKQVAQSSFSHFPSETVV